MNKINNPENNRIGNEGYLPAMKGFQMKKTKNKNAELPKKEDKKSESIQCETDEYEKIRKLNYKRYDKFYEPLESTNEAKPEQGSEISQNKSIKCIVLNPSKTYGIGEVDSENYEIIVYYIIILYAILCVIIDNIIS